MPEAESDFKPALVFYLKRSRESLLWKTQNLSEYDVRRPLVPTGTNLLGLLKHVSAVVAGYFGACFGRPFPEPMPWADEDAEPNADMWATEDESREQIVGLYNRAWNHAEATIAALPLDAVGEVPWWPPDRRHPTLHRVLIHMIAEAERHTGHADILRELIDGAAGANPAFSNLPDQNPAWWQAHHARLEQAAKAAAG